MATFVVPASDVAKAAFFMLSAYASNGTPEEILQEFRPSDGGSGGTDDGAEYVVCVSKREGHARECPHRESLTPREKEVLGCVAEDCTRDQIGRRLGISTETVNTHLKHTFRKLNVESSAGAVAVATQIGALPGALQRPAIVQPSP